MAVELIKAVMKAERSADEQIELARKKAKELIERAEQQAEQIVDSARREAENEARLLVSEAELGDSGILSQASQLARLRERKVTAQTQKKYDESVNAVVSLILNS